MTDHKPNLYVHIGMPKTGTTAIQKFLFDNCELLKDKGYLYPKTGIIGNGVTHYLLSWAMFDKKKLHKKHHVPEGIWSELYEEIDKSRLKNIIISAESFLRVENLVELKKKVERYNTKIIVYLRRQDHLIQSNYGMLVTHPGRKLKTTILDFIDKGKSGFSFSNLLKRWEQQFGRENLVVRVYEKEQLPGGICADFLQAVGLKLTDQYVPPEKSNVSLNPELLEFVRICNRMPLSWPMHERFTEVLKMVSVKNDNRGCFDHHTLLSPQQRYDLVKLYDEDNRQIARDYLDKDDEILFQEDLPDLTMHWEPYLGLSKRRFLSILGRVLFEESRSSGHILRMGYRSIRHHLR